MAADADRGPVLALTMGDPAGIGPEITAVPETEPLGRGGGIRFAAQQRRQTGDLFALNGDELVDVDLTRLLALHREQGAAATITVVPLRSPFGVVDLEDSRVTGFREAPRLDQWVSCGIYVLGEEAPARPELLGWAPPPR